MFWVILELWARLHWILPRMTKPWINWHSKYHDNAYGCSFNDHRCSFLFVWPGSCSHLKEPARYLGTWATFQKNEKIRNVLPSQGGGSSPKQSWHLQEIGVLSGRVQYKRHDTAKSMLCLGGFNMKVSSLWPWLEVSRNYIWLETSSYRNLPWTSKTSARLHVNVFIYSPKCHLR